MYLDLHFQFKVMHPAHLVVSVEYPRPQDVPLKQTEPVVPLGQHIHPLGTYHAQVLVLHPVLLGATFPLPAIPPAISNVQHAKPLAQLGNTYLPAVLEPVIYSAHHVHLHAQRGITRLVLVAQGVISSVQPAH